jgi:hypothetical protein
MADGTLGRRNAGPVQGTTARLGPRARLGGSVVPPADAAGNARPRQALYLPALAAARFGAAHRVLRQAGGRREAQEVGRRGVESRTGDRPVTGSRERPIAYPFAASLRRKVGVHGRYRSWVGSLGNACVVRLPPPVPCLAGGR